MGYIWGVCQAVLTISLSLYSCVLPSVVPSLSFMDSVGDGTEFESRSCHWLCKCLLLSPEMIDDFGIERFELTFILLFLKATLT